MSEENKSPEANEALTGKDLFMAEVSDELLNLEPEAEQEGTDALPQEEATDPKEEVTPKAESEEEEAEDSDEDILSDLLGEEEAEGEAEGTEDKGDIDKDQTFKFTVEGEEVEPTLQELQKAYGRNKVLSKKEMKLADDRKKVEELENTIAHLQYQGEFAPQYHTLTNQENSLEAAKVALAEGRDYQGDSGDDLARKITTADVIIKKGRKDLDAAYQAKTQNVEAPGRKALESRLPDIAEKFNDYAAEWGKIGSEFGYTDVELRNNKDFRDYEVFQEIIDLRKYKTDMQTKLEKAKQKRQGKKVASNSSPRKAPSANSKNAGDSITNYDDLTARINKGDHSARIELMGDLFNT